MELVRKSHVSWERVKDLLITGRPVWFVRSGLKGAKMVWELVVESAKLGIEESNIGT